MTPSLQTSESLQINAADAIERASSSLLTRQSKEGFWWAKLRADTTLESDYILTQLWLYPPVDGVWNPPTRPQVERAVKAILARQLDDGGFSIYLHGPAEISASIKAYFALKVAGLPPFDPPMAPLPPQIPAPGGPQAAHCSGR